MEDFNSEVDLGIFILKRSLNNYSIIQSMTGWLWGITE
jgi:hypothetical protein